MELRQQLFGLFSYSFSNSKDNESICFWHLVFGVTGKKSGEHKLKKYSKQKHSNAMKTNLRLKLTAVFEAAPEGG